MKKIILISMIMTFLFGNVFSQRWKFERFSLGIIGHANTQLEENNLGMKLSLSTRVFKFVSIETNLCTNTSELFGEGGLKIYLIPKKFIRNRRIPGRKFYMFTNISLDTYKKIEDGLSVGYNINNKWRTEVRLSNKTTNQKFKANPYLGIGFFRNLNFHEYPPHLRKNGTW